jgi:uncharacterized protein (TIGR02594 family)
MNEPRWLTIARTYEGVAEIPGPRHSPVIAGWLHRLGAWWADDETPWCGIFCAAVADKAGLPVPRNYFRARAWLDWGVPLASPIAGCVAVLERGPQMGHVGFVVGQDTTWRQFLLILGGNQGNAVNVSAFDRNRVIGYRWPAAEPLPQMMALPAGSAAKSAGEA